MKNKKRGHSIVTQAVVRVSVVFFVITAIMLCIISSLFAHSMEKNLIDNQTKLVENMADTLNQTIDALTVPLVSLADYTPARRLIRGYHKKYSSEWMTSVRSVDAYLSNVNMFYDFIIDIALLNKEGELCYSLTDYIHYDYAFKEKTWFQEALQQDSLIKYAALHGSEHLTTDIPVSFTAIFPVKRNGIIQGYVLAEVDLDQMADLFDGNGYGEEGLLLTDKNGNLILSYRKDRNIEDLQLVKKLKELTEGQTNVFRLKEKQYIVKQLVNTEWFVISESKYHTIIAPVLYSMKIVGVILFCGIILILVIVFFMSRTLEKQIYKLVERIVSYDGSGPIEIEESRMVPWEIMVIRMKFEEMAGNISKLINDVYLATLKKREMELQVLTNQINPHFLYNTLQVIQTKAVLCDNREIEEMILALGGMLRYSMERKKESVSIREELTYIKDYLMFYKMRFPNLFEYRIVCDECLLEYRTIKFLLQPVVENCFKHGFRNRKSGGIIKITISEKENDILFTVYDNGNGIEKERLLQLKKQMSGIGMSTSIGIENTNMRLQLVYGTTYGIQIESSEGEFTEVSFRIRKEEGKDV